MTTKRGRGSRLLKKRMKAKAEHHEKWREHRREVRDGKGRER